MQERPLPPYISIVGAAEAGKSTAARRLAACHGAQLYESATPIKLVAMRWYGMTEEDCFTPEGKARDHPYLTTRNLSNEDRAKWPDGFADRPLKNREVLELIGDKMNEVDPAVLIRPIEEQFALSGLPQVDGSTRTEPQAAFVRERGGIVVYVSNPVAEARIPAGAHHTQTFFARTKNDLIITNDPTTMGVEDFHAAIDRAAGLMKELHAARTT